MELLKEKPQISLKSQKIIMNSTKHYLPLHSPERYHMEVQNYQMKQEASRKKRHYDLLER